MAKGIVFDAHPDEVKIGDDGIQTHYDTPVGPIIQPSQVTRVWRDSESPTGFRCDTKETGEAVTVGYSAAYAANWDAIFGPKTEKEPEPVPDTKRSQLN
jgi:hypothetical protein